MLAKLCATWNRMNLYINLFLEYVFYRYIYFSEGGEGGRGGGGNGGGR